MKKTKSALKEKFVIIQNEMLQSPYMSFAAKGFLCYINSLPDDWVMHKSHVQKTFNIGKERLNSILSELQEAGYMAKIEMVRASDGSFEKPLYLFYDEPIAKKPHSERITPLSGFPLADNPLAGNQQLQSNKLNNTDTNPNISSVIVDKVDNGVELVYSSYPTRCPIKSSSTSKSKANKKTIATILKSKEYTPKQLVEIIEWYVSDCKNTKTYIKNFSTFLNQIPEKAPAEPLKPKTTYQPDFYCIPDLNPK